MRGRGATLCSYILGLHTLARLHNIYSGSRLQGRLVRDDICKLGASQPGVNCQKLKIVAAGVCVERKTAAGVCRKQPGWRHAASYLLSTCSSSISTGSHIWLATFIKLVFKFFLPNCFAFSIIMITPGEPRSRHLADPLSQACCPNPR